MMNGASPSASEGPMIARSGSRQAARMRSVVCGPVRKRSVNVAETVCERMVASAAPRTPMSSANMKIGSRTMFMTAPIKTVRILVFAKPSAVMKALRPIVSWTKTVPSA